MKKLYLIRHAKASWENPEQTDFERSLTDQGKTDAHTMANQLKEQKIKPDLILSSTAKRALETAEIFAAEFQYPLDKIVSNAQIYDGGVEELVETVKSLNSKLNTVLFVGHNPALTLLSHFLCEGLRINITTCGIVGIGFEMKSWENAVETDGQFLNYFHPEHDQPEHYRPYT